MGDLYNKMVSLGWNKPCWGSRHILMILDFNPRPIRRGATSKTEDTHQILVCVDEACWQVPHQGVVVNSSLPFRAFVGKGFRRDSYYRFDGSIVVGRTLGMETSYSFLPLMEDQEEESEEISTGKA
ncbi:10458_t:CDS:2 [Acaulospora colombiana]|uniref:10458_t:CDS:1 n=1 Tax=Acaulospora colombiana TaxID=27376 RepID=A0ACA9QEU9_9GLOM|nr:10458_t:CDS:2 [Acaulospora colombiana]